MVQQSTSQIELGFKNISFLSKKSAASDKRSRACGLVALIKFPRVAKTIEQCGDCTESEDRSKKKN
jgi:hypothetical protein